MSLFGPQHEEVRGSAREPVETNLTPHAAEWERRPEGWRATRWVLRTITSEGSMSVLAPG